MNKIALIPARYASTRFPAKLLQPLGAKSVIATVYIAVQQTGLFDQVFVVTDSDAIEAEVRKAGGQVVRSKKEHESGSDRIAEAVAGMEADVIVNVQGDTPFIRKEPLRQLLLQFEEPGVQVASLMQEIRDDRLLHDPNCVKVCVDKRNNSLFFSRSLIPYPRNNSVPVVHYKHIGVYAFRKKALMDFTTWPVGTLEDIEKLEQLRYLENGVPLRMVLTEFESVEIDTPEDLERARALLSQKSNVKKNSL